MGPAIPSTRVPTPPRGGSCRSDRRLRVKWSLMSEAQQDVNAELEDQLRSRVIAAMGDPSGDLAAMRTVDVLGRWFNWQDRLISPRPRAVHDSAELLASKEAQGNAADLAQIRSEIESGADLTPRLAPRARTAYTPTSDQGPLQRRRDLDLLLSDWGIHHLHLAHAPQRSGLLLFVVFRPDDAYLLQLLPHGSWAKESLVEIIVRNWPDTGLMMGQLKGAIGLSQPISEADRQKLRGRGSRRWSRSTGACT